jgi:hypothetical protein
MNITEETLKQLQSEIEKAIDSEEKGVSPQFEIPISSICANKDLILSFLQILIGILPSAIGKIVGQVVLTAAQTWFSKKCG